MMEIKSDDPTVCPSGNAGAGPSSGERALGSSLFLCAHAGREESVA